MIPKPAIEKRAVIPFGKAPKFGFQSQIPRDRAVLLTLTCFLGVAGFDAIGFHQTWLGPAYMMVIGFAACSIGWPVAIVTLVASIAVGLSLHGIEFFPNGAYAPFSNVATCVLALLLIIGLLDNARRACEREWRLARTDPLTGALNRKAFFESVGKIERSQGWSILAYADLDGLKQLNDQYGHAVGDRGLGAFSEHVRALIREDDLFARIGGDEFLVYMSVRDEEAAKIVARRLHHAMNSVETGEAHDLSCSLGVLVMAPGRRAIDRELRLADELMYDAKAHGSALAAATAVDIEGEFLLRHHELGQGPATATLAKDALAEGGPTRTEAELEVGKASVGAA